MDFLDNLLSSVEAPARRTDPQAEQERARQAAIKKQQEENKQKLQEFTKKIYGDLNSFLRDSKRRILKFPPMDNVHRSAIHDACATHTLVSHGFGADGVNRAVVVFKEEVAPTPEQLTMMDRNLCYDECMEDLKANEAKAKALADQKARRAAEEAEAAAKPAAPVAEGYRNKMQKRFQDQLEVKAPSADAQFGMVSTELKRDKRSVEEAMRDIRARKKARVEDEDAAVESGADPSDAAPAPPASESS
eukprot:m.298599 g.298599  ORF g.298599 m.298599 type:complete len:247 (-) comp13907_c0_seq1:1693-2433(-)